MRAWRASFAACCALLLVSACSFVSFGYQHAPTFVSWRIAEQFELDATQRAALRLRLQAVQEWHRREQLAPLLNTLTQAAQRLDGPVVAADAEWLVDELLAHYRLVVGRIVDESADLLVTLRPDQILALEARMAEKAAEFEETWIDATPEEVRRTRYERMRERAEDWLGRLEPAQRRWLRARLDEIPVDYRLWREDRSRRDGMLMALLVNASEQPGPSVDGVALRRWALDWDDGRGAAQRQEAERLRRAYVALGVELVNSATPAQRARAQARLARYVDALAGQLP